jgi:hypothetical protein
MPKRTKRAGPANPTCGEGRDRSESRDVKFVLSINTEGREVESRNPEASPVYTRPRGSSDPTPYTGLRLVDPSKSLRIHNDSLRGNIKYLRIDSVDWQM